MHTQTRIAIGWLMAAAVAAGGGRGARVSAQSGTALPLSSNQWNTFSVDVTVRATRVSADGKPIGVAAEPVQYRWERSQSGAGWKTTMTMGTRKTVIGEGPSRREIDNPLAVVRIEDDEDGSPLRMYRRDGGRVTPPSFSVLQRWVGANGPDSGAAAVLHDVLGTASPADSGSPRRLVGSAERDWLAAFVATPQERAARQARLGSQFTRRGQVRGLDRFTREDGDQTHEILADPQSVVPLEINALRDGTLVAHSTIAYDTAADGSLVRRSLHSERALPTPTGERAVVDTAYANLRVERRR